MLLLLACAPALAQGTTGAIEGFVTGPDGKPLPDIVVVAMMPATQLVRSGVTTAAGMYRITALQLGEYEVAIQDPGFQPVTVKPVVVRLGRTTAVPALALTPQGPLVERVEVKGKPPVIDPVSTTAGGSLAAGTFDNLPVTRDYLSIAALLPNVSVSYFGDGVNIAGASGFENRYFVDGIDMTQGHNGSVGTSLPPDFIQEVQVKTAGYEAEFRSALGGVVNVVTPSGSNQLAGKFMAYWTSDLVSGETKQSPADLEQEDFTQYDVGFTLSGPIVRDKAWFFVAFDPEFTTVDKQLPGLGDFQDSSTVYRYSGKLNWQVNPTNNVVLTLVGDPLQRDGVGDLAMSFAFSPTSFLNPDPYLRDISSGGNGAALRGTHVLSSRWLLETALSGQWYAFSNLPATERG
ncbi:MAG: TonB-dependent receptor, partial [Acidobacteria bacterium]|nr:TonB-dependent receptor [Acidobacteriota bacterium]